MNWYYRNWASAHAVPDGYWPGRGPFTSPGMQPNTVAHSVYLARRDTLPPNCGGVGAARDRRLPQSAAEAQYAVGLARQALETAYRSGDRNAILAAAQRLAAAKQAGSAFEAGSEQDEGQRKSGSSWAWAAMLALLGVGGYAIYRARMR